MPQHICKAVHPTGVRCGDQGWVKRARYGREPLVQEDLCTRLSRRYLATQQHEMAVALVAQLLWAINFVQ